MDQQHTAILNEYEKHIFNSIETKLEILRWYTVKKDRIDYDQYMSAIKKRIDIHGDCEFSEDYSKFRYIGKFEDYISGKI